MRARSNNREAPLGAGDQPNSAEGFGRGLRLPVKIAVLSQIAPPMPAYGQAVLLYRILKDVDPAYYCLISDRSQETGTPPEGRDSTPRLPGRYHYLRPGVPETGDEPAGDSDLSPASGSQGSGVMGRVKTWTRRVPGAVGARWIAGQLRLMLRRAKAVARIVGRENCGAVLACSGEPFDLPAGYLASKLARVPFYVYLFDDYLYQWRPYPFYYSVARRAEPIVVKNAVGVIVLNEYVRDEYRRRYTGVEPTVVRNAFEIPAINEGAAQTNTVRDRDLRILYTGSVYHAHYDAFCNLLAALRGLESPGARLHLHTGQAREELEAEGIGGPAIVFHQHLDSSEVFETQREADILFLPLAFDSPIPEVIRTSCPMKTGEYLASGRPILVHAPADSFLSWYFKKHECGVVVDKRDPEELARAISRIVGDAGLREKIGCNARARAEADFDLAVAQDEFVKVFEAGTKV